jgi:ribosomal protein S27AE
MRTFVLVQRIKCPNCGAKVQLAYEFKGNDYGCYHCGYQVPANLVLGRLDNVGTGLPLN